MSKHVDNREDAQCEYGAICWYELASHDLGQTRAFYKEVFGWDALEAEIAPGERYFEFHSNNDTVGGLLPIDHRFPAPISEH